MCVMALSINRVICLMSDHLLMIMRTVDEAILSIL